MLAYPLQISSIGGLALSTDPERDRILALLDCRYWERVLAPDFGNPIDIFDPITGTGELASQLELALGYWVGDKIGVTIMEDPIGVESGIIQIQVTYGQGTGLIEYTIDRNTQLPAQIT